MFRGFHRRASHRKKKGLKRLLEMILNRQVKRVVLTHKDRLLRALVKNLVSG